MVLGLEQYSTWAPRGGAVQQYTRESAAVQDTELTDLTQSQRQKQSDVVGGQVQPACTAMYTPESTMGALCPSKLPV